MSYIDVSLAPDEIEWERWPDPHGVVDAVFDNHGFELFVVENGLLVALELVTQLHRTVANQLIRRGVDDPKSSRWAGRAIFVCRQVKWRRRQLRRMLVAELGRDEAHVVIDALDERFPRAVWGSDL